MPRESVWWRDFLVLPIIVGIVVWLLTWGVPKLFEHERELTYSQPDPSYYINAALGNVKVTINDTPTTTLAAYRVELRNTGSEPLKDLGVLVVLNPSNIQQFKLFNITHQTSPHEEFGKIDESTQGDRIRLVYQLLNPGDEDTVTFLVSDQCRPEVYAKQENLKVKKSEAESKAGPSAWLEKYGTPISLAAALLVFLGSGVSTLLQFLSAKITETQRRLVIERLEKIPPAPPRGRDVD